MQIVIGACGWVHDQWNETFYPDDIPLDWRLNYYANEFDSVLVPFSFWSVSDRLEIEGWLDELPSGFEIFFEAGSHSGREFANKILCDASFSQRPVIFSPIKYIKTPVKYGLQEAVIDNTESRQSPAILLRVFADDVINAAQIRQIIERIQEEYAQFGVVYLFFDQALVDMGVISTANIIVDLLVTSD